MTAHATTAESRAAYERALAAGMRTYIGHPCKCGSNVRYVGAGGYRCKACSDARTVAYLRAHKERLYAQKRERQQRRRAAQTTTPEPLTAAGRLGTSTTDRTDERDCTKIEH